MDLNLRKIKERLVKVKMDIKNGESIRENSQTNNGHPNKIFEEKRFGCCGHPSPHPHPLKNRVSRPHIPHLEALRPEAPQHPPGELHLKAT